MDSLNGNLTLRSLTRSSLESLEISFGHLVQVALHRDLAKQLLQRTCQGDLIFYRDLHKGNLQNLT